MPELWHDPRDYYPPRPSQAWKWWMLALFVVLTLSGAWLLT